MRVERPPPAQTEHPERSLRYVKADPSRQPEQPTTHPPNPRRPRTHSAVIPLPDNEIRPKHTMPEPIPTIPIITEDGYDYDNDKDDMDFKCIGLENDPACPPKRVGTGK
jgi:hypothetical protein